MYLTAPEIITAFGGLFGLAVESSISNAQGKLDLRAGSLEYRMSSCAFILSR